MVNLLLKSGAIVNQTTYGGMSPVFMAALNGHEEVVAVLLDNEADIEKLIARRYHRVVIPTVPYHAPDGPMQQVLLQQHLLAMLRSNSTPAGWMDKLAILSL